MYSLRLYQDEVGKNTQCCQLETQHTIIYVLRGSAVINGEAVAADAAKYCQDVVNIATGDEDTILWRWELVPTASKAGYLQGSGVKSRLTIGRRVRMFELSPRTKWLFRLDCIYDNLGSTGLHSHPGSGIRCLLKGNLHVRGVIGESSDNEKRRGRMVRGRVLSHYLNHNGDDPAAFLRGMVLPVEYDQYPDTAMWIEGSKSVQSSWKGYAQQVVMLR